MKLMVIHEEYLKAKGIVNSYNRSDSQPKP